MTDSERPRASLDYLKAGLEWTQLDPRAIAEWSNDDHAAVLIQAARDYRFQRYKNMLLFAQAATRLYGGGKDAGLAASYEGIASAMLGDIGGAFSRLKAARDAWGNVAAHHFNCGMLVLRFSEDLDTAANCFADATTTDPRDGNAWLALATVRLLAGQYAACAEAARHAVALGDSPGGRAELCLAVAQERLGHPVEWPATTETAEPLAFTGEIPTADRVVLSVAHGDGGAGEALRMAARLEAIAPEWGVHIHLCNASEAASQTLAAWAAQRPGKAAWTAETVVADTARDTERRLSLTRLRVLAAFARKAGRDVLLADSRTLFDADPAALLPTAEEGVSLLLNEGLLWDQVGLDLIGVRWGAAAETFLDRAETLALGPWGAGPMAAGVGLWRARVETGLGRRVTAPLLGEAAPAPPPPAGPADINEVVQSRYGPMLLNKHDLYVSAGIRESGVWSGDELDLLSQLIRPGDTVLDVGANMGSHTLAFCNFVGPRGRVHAFEPQRVMFQAMVASVALNSWTNAHCHMHAVGSAPGSIRVPGVVYDQPSNFGILSLTPGWAGANAIAITDEDAAEDVAVITIDGLGLKACHLIKIDVEGMEGEVLRGAAETLRTFRPFVYMECNRGDDANLTLLQSFGYRTWWHGHHGSRNVVGAPEERAFEVLGLQPTINPSAL